ncbi:MAG: SRPBCC family protein [Pseudomonadota bacterium]
MKFSAREDVSAPIADVFSRVSDFDAHERQALRRGFDIERKDRLTAPGVGMNWRVAFDYRGRRRNSETTITRFEPSTRIDFLTKVQGLECTGELDLTRLSATKTRMHVTLDLKPKTFRARVFLQGLKLAKSALTKRFKGRVARFARQIEAGYGDHD